MKRLSDLRRLTTEQISSRVFYVLVGVAALLFALFRFVGYDMPYLENPDYNAPLFTGVVIWFMLLLTLATLVLAVWSMVRAARRDSSESRVVNNVPARRIAVSVAVGTAVVLLLTFALSSAEPLRVNGAAYADGLWLRVAGMFVGTSAVMILAAVAAVVYGSTRYIRK